MWRAPSGAGIRWPSRPREWHASAWRRSTNRAPRARGDTLYSRNAAKLFMPASNMKLVTGAVALVTLGADFRFETVFAADGPVREDVLDGNLLIIGRGDPTLSDRMRDDAMLPMREIADSLAALGIRRIVGDVRAHGDAFPDAIHGFGWGWDDFDFPYSAGVDELMFNEGFWRVFVRGGPAPGEPVTATSHGHTVPPLAVEAATIDPTIVLPGDTVPPRTRTRLRRSEDGTLVVTGVVLAGDSAVLTIAQREPARAYLDALREALADRGIEVIGAVSALSGLGDRSSAESNEAAQAAPGAAAVSGTPPGAPPAPSATPAPSAALGDTLIADTIPPRIDTLFATLSPPLSEILPAFEKPSQNQIGEILFKTLGLEVTGVGTADSGRVVVERQLLAWGIAPDGFAVRDGSGLSRHNYLSPETIVRVLDVMRTDSAFAVFYESLPIAGVDGTIETRMRGTPAEGNLRGKTGTLDRARALSGYVTAPDGRLLIFSTLANNYTVPAARRERGAGSDRSAAGGDPARTPVITC
ncbi:MAG TPA: D-alanyl-D-alanine carboxypeptidase/D-alanyl-D-alanine-endopeptidase [Gemmatimonadaceae bacterium]|nr:D-alanyl-D-alanine carboxypeptidase/D-alanyl-D-alanine-endopeptidase [Gemmatimonadaceae bacterium]